jgi:hypothetical protein
MGENLSQSQKSKGQYFTPSNIVQTIVKLTLNYIDKQNTPLRVLDPATGEGIFSQEVIKLFRHNFDLIHVNALDIDPIVLKEAQSRLLPQINDNCRIDFLLKNFLTESFQEGKEQFFDLIIGNPPHNAKYSIHEWDIIRSMDQDYIQGKKPSESALFFILKSLLLLKEGGVLSFILPKPFCYSNRWKSFRKLCLTRFCLLAVFDLANQFSGQLQEQIVIILRKSAPNEDFLTGVWNDKSENMESLSRIQTSIARQADNFLVSITPNEHKLIEKLYSKCESIEWNAFRGLSSVYRTRDVGTPIIEKATITYGFLLPYRSYLKPETPKKLTDRLLKPKIICQRIISYSTRPIFQLFLPTFIDESGEYLTHETVININPSLVSGINLYSYGALLQSELFSWWLQHVVFTKNFVTSKDLDNPYLKKLLLPKFGSMYRSEFREKLLENYGSMTNNEFIHHLKTQSKIDQFFAIGELFRLYQGEGVIIQGILSDMQEFVNPYSIKGLATTFKRVKRLNYLFTNNRIDEIKKILNSSTNIEKKIQTLIFHYSKIKEIMVAMNGIIYLMYDISSEEKVLISGGRRNY